MNITGIPGHISGLAVVEMSSYQATCSDIDIQVLKKIEKIVLFSFINVFMFCLFYEFVPQKNSVFASIFFYPKPWKLGTKYFKPKNI